MDLTSKEPSDKSVVNPDNKAELRWWARELGADAYSILTAVQEVGSDVNRVRAWLERYGSAEARRRARPKGAIAGKDAKQPKTSQGAGRDGGEAPKPTRIRGDNGKPAGGPPPAPTAPPAGGGFKAVEPKQKEKIDTENPGELLWWANHFNTDPRRLQELIVTIGDRVKDVQAYHDRRAEWEKANQVKRRNYDAAPAAARPTAAPAASAAPQSFMARLRQRVQHIVDAALGRASAEPAGAEDALFVNDPASVAYWAEQLDTDPATLRQVAVTVGTSIPKIKAYLKARALWEARFGKKDPNAGTVKAGKPISRWRRMRIEFFRWRQDLADRTYRRLPIDRIPFIRNKYVLRGIALGAAALSANWVLNYEKVEPLRDPAATLQAGANGANGAGLPADPRAAAAAMGLATTDAAAMSITEVEAYIAEHDQAAAALTAGGELPNRAQRTIDATKKALGAAQETQGARLDAIDQIK